MKRLIGLFAFLLAACGQGADIKVADTHYRPPLVAGAPGVAYFSITSPTADRIVAISSPEAGAVEIHDSVMSADGMAAMKKLDSVALPAGKTVTFGPGGMHVMVFQPKPHQPGATFPIQITLESGRSETISFAGETTGR